jgi:hypothetical protein
VGRSEERISAQEAGGHAALHNSPPPGGTGTGDMDMRTSDFLDRAGMVAVNAALLAALPLSVVLFVARSL